MHRPSPCSHLNLRLLETPLETNSGYATEMGVGGGVSNFPEKSVKTMYGSKLLALGAIQVLRNADGGGGCLIFWKSVTKV